MRSPFPALALLVAVAAIAVGGWIGYRATSRPPECFPAATGGVIIECLEHGHNIAYLVSTKNERR